VAPGLALGSRTSDWVEAMTAPHTPPAVRTEAVTRIRAGTVTAAAVGRELGVPAVNVRNWVARAKKVDEMQAKVVGDSVAPPWPPESLAATGARPAPYLSLSPLDRLGHNIAEAQRLLKRAEGDRNHTASSPLLNIILKLTEAYEAMMASAPPDDGWDPGDWEQVAEEAIECMRSERIVRRVCEDPQAKVMILRVAESL
jgi:hypothetical protein